jgi:hypothetical protein
VGSLLNGTGEPGDHEHRGDGERGAFNSRAFESADELIDVLGAVGGRL